MDATDPVFFYRRLALLGLAAGSVLGCSPSVGTVARDGAPGGGPGTPQGLPDVPPTSEWVGWTRFAERFITPEGRVVDLTFGGKTTSEGQSYGLFFALVAGDRERFEGILRWTDRELAAGSLGTRLPGWLWGLRDDGSWGIKDRGPASDADLWLAYTLLEASRLWNTAHHEAMARALMRSIAAREIVDWGDGRALLLPGPFGFDLGEGRYRFNPSYLPGFLLRALAGADAAGPWSKVWSTYFELAPAMFPRGLAPDLCIVTRAGEVRPDNERGAVGSYDAIRVYLWAGMSDPDASGLMPSLDGLLPLIERFGAPPEKIDTLTGEATSSRYLSPGFAGAVLPFLSTGGDRSLLARVQQRVDDHGREVVAGATSHYYDEALILFGAGWLEGRYRFDSAGRLQVPWAT